MIYKFEIDLDTNELTEKDSEDNFEISGDDEVAKDFKIYYNDVDITYTVRSLKIDKHALFKTVVDKKETTNYLKENLDNMFKIAKELTEELDEDTEIQKKQFSVKIIFKDREEPNMIGMKTIPMSFLFEAPEDTLLTDEIIKNWIIYKLRIGW